MNKNEMISLNEYVSKLPKLVKLMGVVATNTSYLSKREDKPTGLGIVLEKAVKKNPNGKAIFYKDITLTYQAFNAWANRIAHYFYAKGIRKGDVVALFLENRPELLACVAGLAKIGGISAMVNTSHKGEGLVHSLNIVGSKKIVVGEELLAPFEEVRHLLSFKNEDTFFVADTNTLEDTGVSPTGYVNLMEEVGNSPSYTPQSVYEIYKNDVCYYIYTSGTTGLPKAAKFTHGRLMKAYFGFGVAASRLTKDDVMYATLPLYHSTAMVICWGPALVSGAGFAIRRKFSASRFLDDVRKYNVTCFGYVGEICRYLMNTPKRPDDAHTPLRKMVGTGLRPNIWHEFKERFGIEEVYEAYASSEGPAGFINVLNFDNTVGTTADSFAIIKYDKDSEEPIRNRKGYFEKVKKGGEGLLITEINDRSPYDGYTDRGKSDEKILRDVFKKGDAWFNTGDYMQDIGFKHVRFMDRLGDTYRWKGENVATAEVENVIVNFDGVKECAAYGVEIPNTNGRAGMAKIILENRDKDIDGNDLYSHLKNCLPHYAIPVFVRVGNELETTGTHKYKKTTIRDEGFDLSRINEPLYVWLPGTEGYTALTPEIHANINNGTYQY